MDLTWIGKGSWESGTPPPYRVSLSELQYNTLDLSHGDLIVCRIISQLHVQVFFRHFIELDLHAMSLLLWTTDRISQWVSVTTLKASANKIKTLKILIQTAQHLTYLGWTYQQKFTFSHEVGKVLLRYWKSSYADPLWYVFKSWAQNFELCYIQIFLSGQLFPPECTHRRGTSWNGRSSLCIFQLRNEM